MPIDALGEVVGAVAEVAADVVLDGPPRRGRIRRLLYWSFMALVGGSLIFLAYLALS